MTEKPYTKCTIETNDGETFEKIEAGYIHADTDDLSVVVGSVLGKCDYHWRVIDILNLIEEITIKSKCRYMTEVWEQINAIANKRKAGK